MNEINVISTSMFLGKEIDVYGTVENPLFLAKDVAEWIEHSDAHKLVEGIDEDEKLTGILFLSGQNREAWFLTEAGLYETLMLSRKPIAKQFKKGVKEILKQIRKTGSYSVVNQPTQIETFQKKMMFADWSAKFLNLNEASKLGIAHKIAKEVGLEDTLPQVVNAGTDHPTMHSATELLKIHKMDTSVQLFNKVLECRGIVKTATRPGKGGKVHSWKVLQPEYDKYGQNVQDPKFQNQTQIKWYDNLFGELLFSLGVKKELAFNI